MNGTLQCYMFRFPGNHRQAFRTKTLERTQFYTFLQSWCLTGVFYLFYTNIITKRVDLKQICGTEPYTLTSNLDGLQLQILQKNLKYIRAHVMIILRLSIHWNKIEIRRLKPTIQLSSCHLCMLICPFILYCLSTHISA
jgi:hypothetical protein